MRLIMREEILSIMISVIIASLRIKKEMIGEITTVTTVVHQFINPIHISDNSSLIDISGTCGGRRTN